MGTVGDDEALGILGSPSDELRAVAELGPEDLGLLLLPTATPAPHPSARIQGAIPVGASVVGSEAAVPQELGRFHIQPSGCVFGPQSGYAFCRGMVSGGPCRGLSGLEPANNQLPKGFYNLSPHPTPPGERGLLGIVSACPPMSKAGFGCVWEVEL